VATGMPATDHGFSFARLEATRSYLTSYLVDGPLPNGMYLAAEQPSRSLRVVRRDGAEQLLVGGNGHPVGRHPRPGELIDDLYRWTGRHFAGAALTHSWAAQDWQPYGPTPWLLAAERGDRRLYAVGGYAKWGLTNAPAAALRIRDAVCGHPTAGHDRILDRSRPQLRSLPSGLAGNLSVGRSAAQGWLRALGRPGTDRPGTVGLRHGRPVAVGEDCVLSAVCPHLGGIVRWNPAERSWDCPLHGSRFAPDGSVLDGPATHGLSRLEA
ncbi:MAG TPA: Rieske 2Fe-2S domain-containing protein, partial [Microlunatus sp.]|nr:Rieske 2Fe-2S domain-containing protein [Microlunatus sp.]